MVSQSRFDELVAEKIRASKEALEYRNKYEALLHSSRCYATGNREKEGELDALRSENESLKNEVKDLTEINYRKKRSVAHCNDVMIGQRRRIKELETGSAKDERDEVIADMLITIKTLSNIIAANN